MLSATPDGAVAMPLPGEHHRVSDHHAEDRGLPAAAVEQRRRGELRFPVGRMVRAALALAALGTGVWAVDHKLSTVYSVDGVVNAELTVLRAPARAAVTALGMGPAAAVPRGEVLLRLENRSEQRDALRRLELERAATAAQVANIRNQIESFEEAERQFVMNLKRFEVAALHGAKRRLGEAEAEARLAKAAHERDEAEYQRLRGPSQTTGFSVSEIDRARSAAVISKEAAAAVSERVERLRGELESMRAGVYLDSSYNNVPYQQQRADDLRLRLTELRGRLAEQEAAEERLAQTIAYQNTLPKYRGEISVTAPEHGVVWESTVAAGSDVDEGEPLVSLVDPAKLFAVAYLDAKYSDACAAGASIEVRFVGSHDWFPGTVCHVVGGGTKFNDRPLAAAVPKASQKRTALIVNIDQLIEADARATAGATQRVNLIGRKVEVRVVRDVGAGRALRDLFSRS
ncbi:MAG TPA: HlyD family efflux transporter periplasmic adaptor subunit [Tepidisphaeraceae bacterium]|nr:HlyD family efflux transporter periplasmic adaptor subunit [Tepidisphaeraceae bacterium]